MLLVDSAGEAEQRSQSLRKEVTIERRGWLSSCCWGGERGGGGCIVNGVGVVEEGGGGGAGEQGEQGSIGVGTGDGAERDCWKENVLKFC